MCLFDFIDFSSFGFFDLCEVCKGDSLGILVAWGMGGSGVWGLGGRYGSDLFLLFLPRWLSGCFLEYTGFAASVVHRHEPVARFVLLSNGKR